MAKSMVISVVDSNNDRRPKDLYTLEEAIAEASKHFCTNIYSNLDLIGRTVSFQNLENAKSY